MVAEVAGPGQFSKRTDKAVGEANRSLPDAGYGEQATYQEQQQGAPMAKDRGVPVQQGFEAMFGAASQNVVPLDAESSMPEVPVTDGADAGLGRGSDALASSQKQSNNFSSSYLMALEYIANQPGSSDMARNLLRQIKSQL